LDSHLPDQIALYLTICREESYFTTSRITQHLLTNLWVTGLFHAFTHSIDGEPGKPGSVKIHSKNR
jgi:RNA 3'-terminal phosphate cyclase